ncbi:ATP-NAD kinase family protein [Shinella sp.]|uniref:ATP-NAD kinase family protein n=1 Tax=Shinella sp. TaxID=1870904 RepID=UPI0029A8E092|nr:ATP-NAD kinase family protein [Shinella sp.]MDX3975476.1 ATP-NAD kinase family protein [Shinella sp.]
MAEHSRIGLIVNPIAGIGGPLAARSSDGFATMQEAENLGGRAVSADRALRALRRLHMLRPETEIITMADPMGLSVARAAGFNPSICGDPIKDHSTALDTQAAARSMLESRVRLILFAGGDGTARDIFETAAERIPLVGIPSGVKMHSSVFALSPEAAGETVAIALRQPLSSRLAEIMDADAGALAAGRPSAQLFGYAATPDVPRLFQAVKGARPNGGEAEIETLGRMLAREAEPGQLLLFGPGTTMAAIKRGFGCAGTLMGVDAMVDGRVIATDADAATLERLCRTHAQRVLMVGIVGGQGFIFGRGNQQITPDVIRHVSTDSLRIIATREKLHALAPNPLRIDTGDMDLDRALEGYRRVHTGPNDSMIMCIAAGF